MGRPVVINVQTDHLKRRSIRLPDYDYRQPGGYFLTICTHERKMLFGEPRFAKITSETWADLPNHHSNVEIDQFVVMPNHVHGILLLSDDRIHDSVGAQQAAPLQAPKVFRGTVSGSLGAIVRSYKSSVAREINVIRATPGAPVWQRNYYEHVVRNERALHTIRQYIEDNPARWAFDAENPTGKADQIEREFWEEIQR